MSSPCQSVKTVIMFITADAIISLRQRLLEPVMTHIATALKFIRSEVTESPICEYFCR